MSKLSKDRLIQLRNEIVMSEKINQEELEPIIVEALSRYTGRFVPHIGSDWDFMLNEVYPIVQNELPSIFFRNPRAFLKPRNKTFIVRRRNPLSGEMEDIELDSQTSARTQEHILNYLVTEIKYKDEVRKVLLDALLFPHSILWHGYKGNFGMTEEKSILIKKDRVFVKRISPLRFIKDPSVTMSDLDEGKWVGRVMDIPLQDILEDDKLTIDKSQLKGFVGFGDKVGRGNRSRLGVNDTDTLSTTPQTTTLLNVSSKQFQQSVGARFVKVYEVFLRPTKKEEREGKKGKILLLTNEQDKPLRESDWNIKAEGFPAKLLVFNQLNDSLFDMPDIDAYASIADQKNIISNLQIRNAQENSKVWVGISKENVAGEEDVEKSVEGGNTVVWFNSGNPRERMSVQSPGGQASSELYLIDGRIQKNLEDKSGVTDLKRGFLQSGEESAASVKIRAAGGGARPAYRQDIMADFIKGSLSYINQINKQFMTIKDAVRIVGSLDIVWSDKPTKEEIQADVDIELDAVSMLPENPEKEIRELNTILALMFQALSNPSIGNKIGEEGMTFNISPIIEQILIRLKIRNPEIFRNRQPDDQGFVAMNQLKEAQANIGAAITGERVPFPPKPQDDHLAKIEVYQNTLQLLRALGQESDILNKLIEEQFKLFQALQAKQGKAGQKITFPEPKATISAPVSAGVTA